MPRAPLFVVFIAAVAVASTACNLPPPTSVNVDPANKRGTPEYPALVPDTFNFEATAISSGHLTPVCDVRTGKPVNDDKRLAKVMAGVGDWQKNGKKAPPKPPVPVDPNAGPVTVTGKNVAVRIPGLDPGKKATDLDPDWFAVSCDGGKITATLDDQAIDLDALYSNESTASPELWLAGYSLKTKQVIITKLSTKPRPPKVVPNTSFLVYDLSRYLVAKVDNVEVQAADGSFRLFFIEETKTTGVRVWGRQYGNYVAVGRFTIGAAPAAK